MYGPIEDDSILLFVERQPIAPVKPEALILVKLGIFPHTGVCHGLHRFPACFVPWHRRCLTHNSDVHTLRCSDTRLPLDTSMGNRMTFYPFRRWFWQDENSDG